MVSIRLCKEFRIKILIKFLFFTKLNCFCHLKLNEVYIMISCKNLSGRSQIYHLHVTR